MKKILEANNLIKECKDEKILNGGMLDIYQGEFLVIMGSSGSGKTTLLNCLSGMDKITSGRVSIQGENFESLTDKQASNFRASKVGFVFQEMNLIDNLSVEENILLPSFLKKPSIFLCSPITYNLSSLCNINSPFGIYISPFLSIPEINIESFNDFISLI